MMEMEKLTRDELAGMMDHTLLKAYAVEEDFKKLCEEAAGNGFAMVAVNSSRERRSLSLWVRRNWKRRCLRQKRRSKTVRMRSTM